jgi:hypothetical protein
VKNPRQADTSIGYFLISFLKLSQQQGLFFIFGQVCGLGDHPQGLFS